MTTLNSKKMAKLLFGLPLIFASALAFATVCMPPSPVLPPGTSARLAQAASVQALPPKIAARPKQVAVAKPKPKVKRVSAHARRKSARNAVGYRTAWMSGVPVHVVQVDLRNQHVRLRTVRAEDLGARYRTFRSFVTQTRPIAAINGTFFDTASGAIICNLVRDGRLLTSGSVGHTLAMDQANGVRWLATAGTAGGRHDWKNSEFAVSSGPTLVRRGTISLDPRSEGFRDPGLFRRARRAGIGTTKQGKLLLVTVNHPVSLGRFAQIMKKLGANDALNLDGGTSTGLYASGKYLSRPGRKLTNVLLVTVRPGYTKG